MPLPLIYGYKVFSAPQQRAGQLGRACDLCVGGPELLGSLSDFHVQRSVFEIFAAKFIINSSI